MLNKLALIRQMNQQQALMPGQIEAQRLENEQRTQENTQRAQALKDQQAATAAMQEWDGKDINALPGLVLKHGASAQTVLGMKAGIIKQQQDLANLTKDQLANERTKNDYFVQAIDNVKSLPPEQQPAAFQSAVQDAVQKGHLDPQQAQGMQYQGPQQLDMLEKVLMGHSASVDAALKQAEARDKAASAEKTEQENAMVKQYGPMSGPAADQYYRALKQREILGQPLTDEQKASMKAYEDQKKLVPVATAQIRTEGYGKIRQFPVYDTQTKQTVYLDSNEINDAKLTQPGRYVVPQYSPEAIIQQQTGKTFGPGGKGGEEALAFQTAMQHADLLLQAAKALKNGDVRALNSAKNTLATQFGDPDITDFNAIKHVYENEVQKMIAGSHITDAELKKNDATIPDNANFDTISKVLGSYKALAQSKLSLRQKQEELGKKGQSMTSAGGYTAPAGAPTATGPNGHKLVLDGGKWVDAQTGKPL